MIPFPDFMFCKQFDTVMREFLATTSGPFGFVCTWDNGEVLRCEYDPQSKNGWSIVS